jgi:membrane protein CcdC involved in cytochrome C biogenesis
MESKQPVLIIAEKIAKCKKTRMLYDIIFGVLLLALVMVILFKNSIDQTAYVCLWICLTIAIIVIWLLSKSKEEERNSLWFEYCFAIKHRS